MKTAAQPVKGSRAACCTQFAAHVSLVASLAFVLVALTAPWVSVTVTKGILSGTGEFTLWNVTIAARVGQLVLPEKTAVIDEALCDGTPVAFSVKLGKPVCDRFGAIRHCTVFAVFASIFALLLNLASVAPCIRCVTVRRCAALTSTLLSALVVALAVAAVLNLYALSRSNPRFEHMDKTLEKGFICTGCLVVSALVTVVLQLVSHWVSWRAGVVAAKDAGDGPNTEADDTLQGVDAC